MGRLARLGLELTRLTERWVPDSWIIAREGKTNSIVEAAYLIPAGQALGVSIPTVVKAGHVLNLS